MSAALENAIIRRLEDPAQARSDRIRARTVRHIRQQVANETRLLSAEPAAAFLLSLCNRVFGIVQSTPPRAHFAQLAALELVDAMLEIPAASNETVLIRVAHALRLLLQQAGTTINDPLVLQAAAAALGHLARLGSPLTLDLVNFQVKQAFEWLQQSTTVGAASSNTAAELRELAAVLVLKQLAANAPTLFNPHVPMFLDLVWVPIHAMRVDVREAAVLALRVCLMDVASRAERWKRSCYLRVFEQAQAGLRPAEPRFGSRGSGTDERKTSETEVLSPSKVRNRSETSAHVTARIHGSLLVLGELLDHASSDFMAPRFRVVTDLITQHRQHSSKTIQRTVMALLPRVAKLSNDEFRRDYLKEVVAYISLHMDSDQRDIAFLALGRLAASVTDGLLPSLPTLMTQISSSLSITIGMLPVTSAPPSSTKASSFFGFSLFGRKDEPESEPAAEPNADRNRRFRRYTSTAMGCIGMLASALGEQIKAQLQPQIDVMLQTGLSQALIDTLSSIGQHLPSLLPLIQDRLLDMLSVLLQQAITLSPHRSRTPNPAASPSASPSPSSFYSFGFKSAGSSSSAAASEKAALYSSPSVKALQPALPDGRVPVAFLSPASRLSAIRTPAEVAEHDRATILLALRTLASFDWRGQEIVVLALSREVLSVYLQEAEDEIRLQAAITLSSLMRLLAHAFVHTASSAAVFDLLKTLVALSISDASAAIRLSILTSFSALSTHTQSQQPLLHSADGQDASAVMLQQHEQYVLDTHLCQSEILSSLSLCLNDESFAIRERVLALLSSLAPRNSMVILPILRSFLIQLLHSLQHQPDDMDDYGSESLHAYQSDAVEPGWEESDGVGVSAPSPSNLVAVVPPIPLSEQHAKLLLTLISYPGGEKLCRSYAHAILQVLLPKLTHILTMHGGAGRRPQPALLTSLSTAASAALSSLPRSSQLASYILSTLGKLSILAGADMRPSISLLLDLIIDTLSDASLSGGAPSAAVVVAPDEEETVLKRTVAIRTLGQLITSTGNVIDPYLHYPSLLPTLLRLLQEERASGRGNEMARGKRSAGMLITDGDDGLGASHVGSAFSLSTYFLTSTSQREFRLELLKLLAKLGALNPYRFRHSPTLLALQSVESHHASLSGAPPPPTAPGLGSAHFLDTEPLLSDLMAQAESEGIDAHTILHEEYFPSVALRALLRLLLQPRLSHLHVLVLRAVLFIFRSLGAAKSAHYLPAVMPLILSQMTLLATHSMNLTAVGAGPVGYDAAAVGAPSLASSSSAKSLSSLASASQLGDATASDVAQLQLAYLQHLISITQIVNIGMRPFLPQIFQIIFVGHTYAAAAASSNGESSVAHAPSGPSLQLPYWSSPALTSSILRLIEVVSLSLRGGGGDDDFKLTYQPLVMTKLLQLLQHADQNLAASGAGAASPSSRQTHLHPAHATHVLLLKVLHTLQVLGGSGRDALTEFLHTLLPTLMRIAERSLQQIPKDPPHARMPRPTSPQQPLQTPASASTGYQLSVAVIQTLSVLAHLHDCSLHASRLIHVLCRFFHSPGLRPSSLTEACLELLCVLMAQLGFDFLLFYERLLSAALKPLSRRYDELGFVPLNTPASSLSGRSPRITSSASPQQQRQQHRRDLSNSSNEGSITSAASSPPNSGRAQQPVPRRSPSVLALSSSADLSAALPANNLQRFQGMLSQLKQRVEQVQSEKQLPRASGDWTSASDDSPPPPSSSAQPNLSSKDFFHLPLFDSMAVPAVERAPSLETEVEVLSLSNSTSRNTSYTDLSSLAEHDSDTESVGGGASPSITAVNSGPKKLRMSQPNLLRAWAANARSTKDDWAVWMRGFSLELLKESPSPSLRACSLLAQKFPALAQTLFNAAFLACWPELTDAFQDDLISNLEFIFAKGQPPTRGAKIQQEKARSSSATPADQAQASTPNRSQAPSPSPSTTPRRISSPGPVGRGGSTSAVPSSIVTALLNLCEFMEHMECTLPINIGLLSALSVRCHAFATALHYQEIEFHQTAAATQLATIAASPSDTNLTDLPSGSSSPASASIQAAEATIESLITISNKLGQKAAADGILKLMRSQQMAAIQQARRSAMQRDAHAELASMRQAQILIKPVWFERLQRWEDALEAYEQRQEELLQVYVGSPPTSPSVRMEEVVSPNASPDDRMDFEGRGEYIELMLGKMRCLRALGEWEQLATIAQGVWNRTDDPVVRRELCPLAAAAACNLHRWDSMAPLMLYWDEDGSAVAAAAASSPLSSRTSSGAVARGSDRRHRFDTNYYSAIFLVHKGRFGEARSFLDRAVEVLDPQLTALVGESYSRAYKSLLLLQRVAQLEEIIDFKLSGPKGASSSTGSPLTPRQVLLQRMWSSRMLGGLSRGGEDIEAWGELLMQQQLLRTPGSSYYNEHNLDLYLEWCEICRKQAMSMGTAATDVPLASVSLSGEHRTQNPFLKRSERVLHNMIGFSPLELLPDATGTSAGLVSSSRRLQQLLETTRPRTKLPHLLFAIWKNLYAQGYRIQAFHRLKDMVSGAMENDVFPCAMREAAAQASNAALSGAMDPDSNLLGTFLGVTELEQLRALCYIRLGKWQMSMLDESLSQRAATSTIDINAPRTPYSPFPNSSSFTFSYPAPALANANPASPPLSASAQSLHEILAFFRLSTVLDPVSVRAWHEYGMLQAKICTSWKFLLVPQAAQHAQQQAASSSGLAQPPMLRSISNFPVPMPQLTPHIVAAIHAFFRSISLQPVGDNSLQDILRILALWFEFGASESAEDALLAHQMTSGPASPTLAGIAMVLHSPTPPIESGADFAPPSSIAQAMMQGLNLIALEQWLTVIPQLIARIHVASGAIRGLLLELLCRVGRAHPQALIYPLTVASKSLLESRRRSAVDVLDHMRTHSSTLVAQAAMVSTQLVRVAILWYEMFHEGLEEASRHWFGSHDFPAMMRVLEPLHALLSHVDGLSIREAAFVNTYGRELAEAMEYCRRYERAIYAAKPHKPSPSSSPPPGSDEAKAQAMATAPEAQRTASYMNRAWEIYTTVFRKLNKQVQSTHELELSDISPQLLLSRDLELAVPGSYRAGAPVVRISLIEPLLRIIDSKQHPRRLGMLGSDGVSYPFLLKGHEDLRQDERVMQLFGLVNTLLVADHATAKSDLSIRRYAVVPLSPNSGLIEWVPNSDPMHTTIKRYRDARCLLNGTQVRLACGGSKACESVTPADVLVGANGQPVRVASVQPNLPRHEIWQVNHDDRPAAYSVSTNHRLTLVCTSNPCISISSKPDANGTYSMQAFCLTPDGRWTSDGYCWTCEVLGATPDSSADELDVFDEAALARLALIAEDAALNLPVQQKKRGSSSERHRGTRAQLAQKMRAAFFSRPRSEYLLAGDLLERTPSELLAAADNLQLGCPFPRVAGVRVPASPSLAGAADAVASSLLDADADAASSLATHGLARVTVPLSAEGAHEAVASEAQRLDAAHASKAWTAIAVCQGEYSAVQYGVDTASIVYLLPQPLSSSAPFGEDGFGHKCSVFSNMESWQCELGIDVSREQGIIVTHLNPIASLTDEMKSGQERDRLLCERSVDHTLSYGTGRVLVFGAAARSRWLQEARARGETGAWTNVEDGWVDGVCTLSFTADSRRVTVFFSLLPSNARQKRAIMRAMAAAHGVPLSFAQGKCEAPVGAIRLAYPPVSRVSADVLVTNIEIQGERDQDRRYVIEDGFITHNSILLNIEQRLMVKFAPDYNLCTVVQKVEVFEYALSMTTGLDLARVMWLHAPTAESWLDRRTTFTSSTAVMCMVGYILGLGDRHTCNILLDRQSGACVHIDFGDCFEVSMQRDKFPERVPFRLTRMIVNAFEVAGIEGTFRTTSEKCMRVLRKNKNSIMAVLEAFSLDPLLNWRLLDVGKKRTNTAETPAGAAATTAPHATSQLNTAAPPQAPNNRVPVAAPVPIAASGSQQHSSLLLAPMAPPHSHVNSSIAPLLAERALNAQQQQAQPLAQPARNAVDPAAAPTSILGMLVHIPAEQRPPAAASTAAAAVPTAVPTAPLPTAATAHAKAEATIVAGAAEPGFGSKTTHSGPLGAVDEGDENDGNRAMPPSPAHHRRSVMDESTLAVSGGAGASSTAQTAASAAAVHSRLEQLNQQAQAVMTRVESKLKGTEWAAEFNASSPSAASVAGATTRVVGFAAGQRALSDSASSASSFSPSPAPAVGAAAAAPLTVAAQVQRLIEEATSHVNLAQAYIGWCPFW